MTWGQTTRALSAKAASKPHIQLQEQVIRLPLAMHMRIAESERICQVNRAITLEYVTVFYNVLEGVVSISLGGISNSVALVGFGLDSFIESLSGLIVLRRFRQERAGCQPRTDVDADLKALRGVGYSFLVLAAYIAVESIHKLSSGDRPDPSVPGIVLALVSLVVMPILARKKYQTGHALGSGALVSDSKQTIACALLSVTLLVGLLCTAVFGWWWADSMAGLAMVPWLVWEGIEGLRGHSCC